MREICWESFAILWRIGCKRFRDLGFAKFGGKLSGHDRDEIS